MHSGQIHVPTISFANKILIIACVVFFILQNIFSHLVMYLGLSAADFFSGHLYQIFTYPLMGRGLMEVLFNSLLLWFVGSELEHSWGTKRYVNFLLVAVLGSGITYLLFSLMGTTMSLTGLAGIVNFLMLAYAILYPNRLFTFMFIFPIKAKYFCMIIVGMELFFGIFSPMGAISLSHLGAMVSGYAYMVYLSRPKKRPKPKGKANLYLVKDLKKGEKNDPPKHWH